MDIEKIRIETQTETVDSLLAKIQREELHSNPGLGNLGSRTSEEKTRPIEWLLLRIPLPPLYVLADENEHWTIADGSHAIASIHEYVTGHTAKPIRPVLAPKYLKDLSGRKFEDLPRAMQRRIRETRLTLHVIQPGAPEELAREILVLGHHISGRPPEGSEGERK